MRFAHLNAKVRPAEYALVPDVKNDALTVAIVSLVIGLASTAISLLLRPDIPDQRDNKRRTEELPDQVGPSRFNQTSSFDGFASLVEYGKPVQIPFGKMGIGQGDKQTGGIVLAGSLVWSRAFSNGTYQRAKLLYTMGQWIPAAPEVRGFWLGTTSLASLGNSEYALYWKSREGENRIQMANRIAGTQGNAWSGDPETQAETFIAPVDGTIEGPGFCMVYNPTSSSKFGQHSALPNGSAYRLNWEVVSIPFSIEEKDAEDIRMARAKRVKISGEFASTIGLGGSSKREVAGQPGVGRAYSTQMGLVAYALPGQDWVAVEEKVPEFLVSDGMLIRFRIHNLNLAKELDKQNYLYQNLLKGDPDRYGIDHEDVNAAVTNRRIRADDLMVVGSKWMIGQTLWVVAERSPNIWSEDQAVLVTLKNVGTAGSGKIGFPGQRAVKEPLAGYEGPYREDVAGPKPDYMTDNGFNTKKHCGANFWSICRYETATVRMIRDADTIEFGIRSVVYNQARGLCNFNALLRPQQLFKRDKADVSVNTPTMNRYFKRTSCFSIWVRPVKEFSRSESDNQDWERINQVYCVTGESPREMFNYIRIRPRTKGRYEFRFIPRTGSDIAINGWEGAIYNQLDASGTTYGDDHQTPYGAFRVTFTGHRRSRESLIINTEMVTRPGDVNVTQPLPTTKPTALSVYAWSAIPGLSSWYKNAFLTTILGSPFGLPVGYTGQGYVEVYKKRSDGTTADDGWIKVGVRATVNTISGPRHAATFGTNKNWAGNGSGIQFFVIDDGYTRGQWAQGDQFVINASMAGNPYAAAVGYSSVTAHFSVSAVAVETEVPVIDLNDGERIYELQSQVSDVSHYDELVKSNANGPEHQIVYVNEAVSEADGEDNNGIPQYEDLAMMGLSLKSSQQITSIEQPRIWVTGGVSVERLTTNGVIGVSNLFTDLVYYLLTNKTQGVGDIIPEELVDRESFRTTGLFLEQMKIHCNGVVETLSNIRGFVTEQASRHLCIFTIKNGVFGIQPALPIDSSNAISQQPIPVQGRFTKGNILEGSYRMNYNNLEDRRNTAYAVRFRTMRSYELPEEKTLIVKFKDSKAPIIEDLDLTQFCDNEEQAKMVARFALATRKFTDHTIEFQTTPEAVGVEPGSYISVATESIAYDPARSMRVNADLTFTAAQTIEDGTYSAFVYKTGDPDATEREVEIKDQKFTDSTLAGALISVFNPTTSSAIYQVQEITIDESAIVSITATIVPTESDYSSKVARYTMNPSLFEVEI